MKIERELNAQLPKAQWTVFSDRVIFHGRRVCHAKKPACGACFLAPLCPTYGPGPTDPEAAAALVVGPEREHLLSMVGLDAARRRAAGDRRPLMDAEATPSRAGRCRCPRPAAGR